MKRLDSSSTKDFVKDGDFSEQFTSDLLETTGQFSNICKSYLQIVAKVRELVDFQARDDRLNDD